MCAILNYHDFVPYKRTRAGSTWLCVPGAKESTLTIALHIYPGTVILGVHRLIGKI